MFENIFSGIGEAAWGAASHVLTKTLPWAAGNTAAFVADIGVEATKITANAAYDVAKYTIFKSSNLLSDVVTSQITPVIADCGKKIPSAVGYVVEEATATAGKGLLWAGEKVIDATVCSAGWAAENAAYAATQGANWVGNCLASANEQSSDWVQELVGESFFIATSV